jgi:hypothetical protein
VTQPFRGAKKEGARGMLKGFGRGFGGLVLKTVGGKPPIPLLRASWLMLCKLFLLPLCTRSEVSAEKFGSVANGMDWISRVLWLPLEQHRGMKSGRAPLPKSASRL